MEAEKFKIYGWQDGDLRKLMVLFQFESELTENQESQWCRFQSESKSESSLRKKNISVPVLKLVLREYDFFLIQTFILLRTSNGLDEAHPHWGWQFAYPIYLSNVNLV